MAKKKIGETSYKETAFGIIPRSKLILLEIEGIKKAWDFILAQKDKAKLPFTPSFLQKIHKIGFAWIFPEMGGNFRKIEVKVSKHTPPEFYLVPQLMVDFCADVKARLKNLPKIDDNNFTDELIELLAWSHHRFLWIHPFPDYNGRIARLLINIIMLNLDLPPIELKVETEVKRKKYIKALQEADRGEQQALEKIIKSAFLEAIREVK